MRPELLIDWSHVRARATEWDTCVAHAPRASVFQSFAWNDAWWNSFGEEYECRVILIWQGENRLAAIAPLVMKGNALMWLAGANHASDYSDIVVAEDAEPALVVGLIAEEVARLPWRSLDFRGVRADSPVLAYLVPGLESRGSYALAHEEVDCPARVFGNPDEDRALLAKKSLKRHFQKMKEKGEFSFRHLDQADEIRASLEDFFAQHIGRRKLAGDGSLFEDPRQKRFYQEAAVALSAARTLRFSVVRSRGVAVAYHFGFEWRGKYIWYKPTFHPDYGKESPGEVLLKCLFEHCIENGLTEFDFTVGNEAFKYRFANVIRRNHRLRAWRNRLTRDYYQLRRLGGLALGQARAWRESSRESASPKE